MDFEGQDISESLAAGIKYMYELDHDFVCIRRQRKSDFYEFYQKSLENYVDGDWVNAQSNLTNALMMMPNDGPARWMSTYLERQKNLVPEGWSGFRDLDKKQQVQLYDGTKSKDEFTGLDQDANPDSLSDPLSPKSPETV